MPYSHPQGIDRRSAFRQIRHLQSGGCLLAATAGFINTVALGFFRTPVSHMTGAVSHLGIDLATAEFSDATTSASIILGFLAGAMISGVLVGAYRLIPGRSYGITLMAEGGLLALATTLLLSKQRFALPLAAMACGLQNAMTSSYCGLMIRTTHVTGTVTDIGVMIGHWIRHREIEGWKLRFLVLIFLSFGVGGWTGALADRFFGPMCLAVISAGCTLAGGAFWFLTHRGIIDLMQEAKPMQPRTSMFPSLPPTRDPGK